MMALEEKFDIQLDEEGAGLPVLLSASLVPLAPAICGR